MPSATAVAAVETPTKDQKAESQATSPRQDPPRVKQPRQRQGKRKSQQPQPPGLAPLDLQQQSQSQSTAKGKRGRKGRSHSRSPSKDKGKAKAKGKGKSKANSSNKGGGEDSTNHDSSKNPPEKQKNGDSGDNNNNKNNGSDDGNEKNRKGTTDGKALGTSSKSTKPVKVFMEFDIQLFDVNRAQYRRIRMVITTVVAFVSCYGLLCVLEAPICDVMAEYGCHDHTHGCSRHPGFSCYSSICEEVGTRMAWHGGAIPALALTLAWAMAKGEIKI